MTSPAELFVDGHRFIAAGERILEGKYVVPVLRSDCAGCGGTFDQVRWTTGPAAPPPVRLCMACSASAPSAVAPLLEAPALAPRMPAKARLKRWVAEAVAPPPTGLEDFLFQDKPTGRRFTVKTVVQGLADRGSIHQAMKAIEVSTRAPGYHQIGKVLAAAGWASRDPHTGAYAPTRGAVLALGASKRARTGDQL